MALHIRSAPRRFGLAVATNFAGGAATELFGNYDGSLPRSFICQTVVGLGGTFGTNRIVVRCQDFGTLSDGADFSLEFPSTYVPGTPIPFIDGLSIAVKAGIAGVLFTVTCTPVMALPLAFSEILDSDDPVVYLMGNDLDPRDGIFEASDGTRTVFERMQAASVTLAIDIERSRAGVARTLAEMKRSLLTVGEAYTQSTRLLYRGGLSLEPIVGQLLATLRTADIPYRDPASGLYRRATSRQMPMAPGFETASRSLINQYTRCTIPLKLTHIGSAMELGETIVNRLPHWKFIQTDNGTTTQYWTVGSGASTLIRTPYRGVIDRESGWPVRWTTSVPHYLIPTSGSSNVQSEEAVVSAGERLAAGVWVRGSGSIDFEILTGTPGSVTTLLHKSAALLQPDTWHLVTTSDYTATVPGGHTRARLRILAQSPNVQMDADIAQLNPGSSLGQFVASDGAALTVANPNLQCSDSMPDEGLLFFAVACSTDGGGGTYNLFRTNVSKFMVQRDATSGAERWLWHTNSPSVDPMIVAGNPSNWFPFTWKTIGLAWRRYPQDTSKLERAFYVDGVLVQTDQTTDFATSWQSPMFFGGTSSGIEDTLGWRMQDILLDFVWPDAARVAELDARLSDPDLYQTERSLQGRFFRIASRSAPRRTSTNPNHIVPTIRLEEHDRHEPSMAVAP